MATGSRPKYRNADGCCICRRKSSSSRFAGSKEYEMDFEECFLLCGNQRTGRICNACVLIIKRFRVKKEKNEADDMNFSHVVDSRLGPGTKNMNKIKKKLAEKLISVSTSNGEEMRKAVFRVPGIVTRRLAARAARKAAAEAATKQNETLARGKVDCNRPAAKKVVRWPELIRRRVVAPSDVLSRRPETEAYETCCGIIFYTPMSNAIWVDPFLFRQCNAFHQVHDGVNEYQQGGLVAFLNRISEIHEEEVGWKKANFMSSSCASEGEPSDVEATAFSPAATESESGVEVMSSVSVQSPEADSLEFSEHEGYGSGVSSPASDAHCESNEGLAGQQDGSVLSLFQTLYLVTAKDQLHVRSFP